MRVCARTRAHARLYARGTLARARFPDPRRTADPLPPLACSFRATPAKGGNSPRAILTAFPPSFPRSTAPVSRSRNSSRERRANVTAELFRVVGFFVSKEASAAVRPAVRPRSSRPPPAPAWSARRECLLVHCGFVTREMLSQSSWVATRNLFSEQHRNRKKVRALPTRTQGPTIRFETPWH